MINYNHNHKRSARAAVAFNDLLCVYIGQVVIMQRTPARTGPPRFNEWQHPAVKVREREREREKHRAAVFPLFFFFFFPRLYTSIALENLSAK